MSSVIRTYKVELTIEVDLNDEGFTESAIEKAVLFEVNASCECKAGIVNEIISVNNDFFCEC